MLFQINKKLKNLESVIKKDLEWIIIFITFLLLITLSPLSWNNLKYILFSFGLFFYFVFHINDKQIPIYFSDSGWLIFVIIGGTSYFWSINPTLVWYPLFGWISLILWMLIVRSISFQEREQYLLISLSILWSISLVYIFIMMIFDKNVINRIWNYAFGYNHNYVTSYLVSLSPFVIFFKSKNIIINILKFSGLIFLVYVLWKLDAKGAFLAFLFFIFYLLWVIQSNIKIVFIPIIVALFLLLIDFYLFDFLYLSKLINLGDSHRKYMLLGSWEIFKESPFLGIGLGNWHIDAYKFFDLGLIEGFNHPYYRFRLDNHNLFTQILSELGLTGIICFFLPVSCILWKGFIHANSLTIFQKAAFTSFCCYLLCSLFYRDINHYEFHFSSIQILAFSCLGILTREDTSKYLLPLIGNKFLVIIALACLVWFSYSKYNCDSFSSDKLILEGDYDMKIINIKKKYNSAFKTTHGFFTHGGNRLLNLDLAFLFLKKKDFKEAEKYLHIALSQAPNNEYILINLAKILLRQNNDKDTAMKYARKANTLQSNRYETHLLLAEIYIEKLNYDSARKHLLYLEPSKVDWKMKNVIWLIEQQLDLHNNIEYITGELSQSQKDSIKDWLDQNKLEFKKIINIANYFDNEIVDFKKINQIVNERIKEKEEILLNVLTFDQFIAYNENKWKTQYTNQREVNKIAETVAVSLEQKEELFNVLLKLRASEEYIDRLIYLNLKTENSSNNNELREKKAKIIYERDSRLFRILGERGFRIYKKSKLREIHSKIFRFYKDKFNLSEETTKKLELIIVNSEYQKCIMPIKLGVNNKSLIDSTIRLKIKVFDDLAFILSADEIEVLDREFLGSLFLPH